MKKHAIGILLWCWAVTVSGLTLEITQGVVGAAPIAVSEFYAPPSLQHTLPEDLGEIIRNDLKSSGRFAPLEVNELPVQNSKVGQLDILEWLNLGTDAIVVGQVEKTGRDTYTVDFELMDMLEPKVPGHKANVLLKHKFEHISGARLRALAHHISDLVFERLTGIKGAFSTRIAYVLVVGEGGKPRYRLEVADADGHNAKTLFTSPEPVMSPAWAPDGKRLAFVSFEHFRSEVYIIDLATGSRQRVSHAQGINGAPAWSPDGKKLAIVLSKEGTPKVYILDLATQSLRRMTSGSSIDTEPSWAPDGKSLVFTSNRGGKPQIYRAWLADGNVERVTYQGNYNARSSFTPDGRSLVMMYRDDRNIFRIAKLNLATKQVTLLTNAELDESPSIAPNGTMVLYGSQVSGKRILGAVSLDGRVKLRLPDREGSVQEPAWSPYLL